MANEVDDRLVGDPVWELFPDPAPGTAPAALRSRRWPAALAGLVLVEWFVCPPLAVVVICLVVAARDFRDGRRLARSIADKAGGTICARFAYAWGAAKLGLAAFVLMFVVGAIALAKGTKQGDELPPAFITAELLVMGGCAVSALLTISGLLRAYRAGMRVWIGEGVNQARTLLLGTLVMGFTVLVLGPLIFWLVGWTRLAGQGFELPAARRALALFLFGCLFAGPLAIVLVLDWLSRRVVADRPGKFGPKVPTVGKWSS